jgi:putative flippase GtrA
MALLDKSRKRFLAKFFVVGACAPAVSAGVIYALRDLPISWGHSEFFGWALYCIYFAAFPTQIVFLDAEHLPEILFLLVLVAPFNGAWYVFVAIVFWFLRASFRRLTQRGTSSNPIANS